MTQATDQDHAGVAQSKDAVTGPPIAPAEKAMTQQRTLQTIEKTTREKVIKNNDWLSVSVTLWPIAVVIILMLFYKQVASVLQDLAGFTFGSFSLKLRRRMSNVVPVGQFEKVKSLSASHLKLFFVIGSQSWKIKKVEWNFDIHESLKLHEKLEEVGLIVIKNKDSALNQGNVDSKLTDFGEEMYQELASLLSESIR